MLITNAYMHTLYAMQSLSIGYNIGER